MKTQSSKFKAQSCNSKFKVILLLTFALNFYLLTFTFYLSYAQTVSSSELIENARSIDGTVIAYKGEIVTTILNRGEHSWVNLNDGRNAIGIWCRTQDLAKVKFVGSYKDKGDVLEVEGLFNRACPLHGGELDIHADKVKTLEEGYPVEEKADKANRVISIALFLITLSLIIIFRRRISFAA